MLFDIYCNDLQCLVQEQLTVIDLNLWTSCNLPVEASKFLSSVYLANFIVIVVFLDAYSTCRDIDARANGLTTPEAFLVLSDMCLVLYTLELLLHICLQGFGILHDWMICMDLGIVVCGYLEMVLDASLDASESLVRVGVVRALRLVRIFRLIRLLRKIRTLRELHKLATMMAALTML